MTFRLLTVKLFCSNSMGHKCSLGQVKLIYSVHLKPCPRLVKQTSYQYGGSKARQGLLPSTVISFPI